MAKILQVSNLKGIGIFFSNITVITLNKFGKHVRGCFDSHIIWYFCIPFLDAG